MYRATPRREPGATWVVGYPLDAARECYQIGNVATMARAAASQSQGRYYVRIITETRLTAFWRQHADSEMPLKAWRRLVRSAQYHSPHDVKADFPTADFLGKNVTVFNIGGNKYRLVVSMRYDLQRVYIRHVLTHEEYDRKSQDGTL